MSFFGPSDILDPLVGVTAPFGAPQTDPFFSSHLPGMRPYSRRGMTNIAPPGVQGHEPFVVGSAGFTRRVLPPLPTRTG